MSGAAAAAWRSGLTAHIPPADLEQPILADRQSDTKQVLIAFLSKLDMTEIAGLVRQAAVTELEYTT